MMTLRVAVTTVLAALIVPAIPAAEDESADQKPWLNEKAWPALVQPQVFEIQPSEGELARLLKQRHNAAQIRGIADVFASLKADLIAMSADYPQFADVRNVAIGKRGITYGIVYEHNCGFGGKRGYKDTGPNAVAIGIEVMTFSEFSEKVDTVAMQAPLYRWKKLKLVGWPRLHFGKDLPEALVKRLERLYRKHIDMIEQLDRGALAPGTPKARVHDPNGS